MFERSEANMDQAPTIFQVIYIHRFNDSTREVFLFFHRLTHWDSEGLANMPGVNQLPSNYSEILMAVHLTQKSMPFTHYYFHG